ncbi:MAG: hypothetical protein HYY14_01790 [Candidatus Omnitrophica bacterium]|nr:hypothetical protein [Candidatus Omnitrophota bacterium]
MNKHPKVSVINLLKVPADVTHALCVMAWVCRLVRSGGVRDGTGWVGRFDRVVGALRGGLL